MSDSQKPSIIGSTDYRDYLRAIYAHLKQTKPFFSYRYFNRKAGIRAPAFLKMVMDGERNLTPATTEKVIAGLGLHAEEADYLRILVRYNQADKDSVRNRYFAQLRKYMERRKINTLSLDQYDYFSNWYIPIIREMIPCEGFQKVPDKIREFLFDEVSREQVQDAIQILMRLQLVEFEKKGALKQRVPHLKTDDAIASLALKNYHRELMQQAIKSIERSRPNEREMQALTLSIDPAKVAAAKKRIAEFISEMRDLLQGGPSRQVYQLNVQLFNLTKEKFPS